MSTSAPRVVSWLVRPDYVSVNLMTGKQITPFQLDSSHPTFDKMVRALKRKDFKKVPELVSLAENIASKTQGRVTVKNGQVFYKGVRVDNSISHKILELIDHQKSVVYLLKFMDNLYQNPSQTAVNEVYDWLRSGVFALTTDGCFLAYKRVRRDYRDFFTGTIDHHPGSRPMMPREEVDPDRYQTCSVGLHFCSNRYLPSYHGGEGRVIELKVNPRDVVAIPADYNNAKGRAWTYEVLRDIERDEFVEGEIDTPRMLQPIIEMPGDREGMYAKLWKMPSVIRLRKRGKMNLETLKKAPTDRLERWIRTFSAIDYAPEKSKLFDNPMRFAREAAGLTLGQIATELGINLKAAHRAEMAAEPEQGLIDRWLKAVEKLQGNTNPKATGVSYPRPVGEPTTEESEELDEASLYD